MKSDKRRKKKNRERKHSDKTLDISDLFLWIPELLLLPFRFIVWIFRGVWRLFD